jgi:hypothetical protein
VDIDDLSPMWADWENRPHVHYYIKELAQLDDGRYVVPMKWITINGEVHAEAHSIIYSEQVRTHPNVIEQN